MESKKILHYYEQKKPIFLCKKYVHGYNRKRQSFSTKFSYSEKNMIYMTEKNIVKYEIMVKELPMLAAKPAPLGLIGFTIAALVLTSTELGCTSNTAKSLLIP